MRLYGPDAALVFFLFQYLVAAHDHTERPHSPQEPFIGETKEDLDAKWGTDVSLNYNRSSMCDTHY